jgi:hypothetical protein
MPARRTDVLGRVQGGDVFFGAGLAALLGWAAWCGRGVWFFIDEWSVITRYHEGHWLTPFNGHLSIIPIAFYRTLLSLFGYTFWPERVVALACYAAVAIAVFWFARLRVAPLVAALAALLVAWSSQAQLLIMFPLLINFTIPIAVLVVIWILLDRDTFRADVLASVLLALALATSSVALVGVITIALELVLQRETQVRRWLTFAPPFLLWLLWYAFYGAGHTGAGGSVGSVLSFAWHQFLATWVGLAAGWKPGGVLVFAAVVGVVALSIARWKTFDRRALVILLTFFGFLALNAIGRNAAGKEFHVPAIAPDSERFVWVDALLVVCLVVQCVRRQRMHVLALLAAVVLLVGNAIVLGRDLRDYHSNAIANARNVRTVLIGIDALGSRADPTRELPLGFIPVPTRAYQSLVRHYGSPVAGVSVDALGDEPVRAQVDGWMIHDLGIHIAPGAPSGCQPLADGAPVPAPATVAVQAATTPVNVFVRRLAETFDAPALGQVTPGAPGVVEFPKDNSALPWYVHVDDPSARLELCN